MAYVGEYPDVLFSVANCSAFPRYRGRRRRGEACVEAGTRSVACRSIGFTFDEKANAQMAKKMNIPVYFAVPKTAYADLPPLTKTSDKLIDFKHPDAKSASGDVGLRLVAASRSGLAKRLAQSGLVQTGDLLLSFRTEWGGAGAYPNIQMGISHTGLAYVKDGYVHNIDNPLSNEYLGSRSDLTSEHYSTLDYIHVIRPRGLTDQEKANLVAWASLLASKSGKVYPSQLSFNQDYQAPKYKPGHPLDFVKRLGQIALGQNPPRRPARPLLLRVRLLAVIAARLRSGQDGGRVQECVGASRRASRSR